MFIGLHTIKCDKCGVTISKRRVRGKRKFARAKYLRSLIRSDGWIRRKPGRKWLDLCPACQ